MRLYFHLPGRRVYKGSILRDNRMSYYRAYTRFHREKEFVHGGDYFRRCVLRSRRRACGSYRGEYKKQKIEPKP